MQFRYSMALFWGFEYGMVRCLVDGARSVDDIARETGVPPSRVGAVLDVLAGQEIVRYDAASRRFDLAEDDRELLREEHDLLREEVAGHRAQVEEWLRFDLRGSATIEDRMFSTGEGLIEYLRMVRDANAAHAESLAEHLVSALAPERLRRVLDLGGGHARYAVALKRRVADARVEVLDLDRTVEASRRLNEGDPTFDALGLIVGDARDLDALDDGYSLIMINDLLHGLSGEDKRKVVRGAVGKLGEGGRLLVSKFDHEVGEDRNRSSLMSLKMSVNSAGGYLESNEEVRAMMEECGALIDEEVRLQASKITLIARRS